MAAPSYDPYLQFNPTFRYGGRSWGANDMEAFKRLLRKRGVSYDRWARNHGNAAKVFDPVEQQMYGLYKPQLDAINYERQKAAAASQRRAHDLAGFTQAIMGMLGEISPAVRGAYGEGAETMRASGTGYGDVLNTDMARTAGAGNSLLDVLGSGQRIEGGDAGSVLAGMAGWLPAEMLQKQGAAYGDALAQLPKEASFQAQMEMKNLLADAAEQDSDFSRQIMDVLSGIPNTRAELAQARSEQRLANQKLRLDALDKERKYWLAQKALLLDQGKLKLARQAEKRLQAAQRRYDYESQGRDSEGNPQPGFAENPKTGLVYDTSKYKLNANGDLVAKAKASSRSTKLSPTALAAAMNDIDGKKEDIQDAILLGIKRGEWTPASGNKKARHALMSKIFKQYQHLTRGNPKARARLRALIAGLLQEASKMGPPAPGNDGWDWGASGT